MFSTVIYRRGQADSLIFQVLTLSPFGDFYDRGRVQIVLSLPKCSETLKMDFYTF